jgi:hypothetical protein
MDAEEPLTPADLSAIEDRYTAATPGPWCSWIEGRDHDSDESVITTGGIGIYIHPVPTRGHPHDQDFIAAARQDIPRLVAEVRRLHRLLGDAPSLPGAKLQMLFDTAYDAVREYRRTDDMDSLREALGSMVVLRDWLAVILETVPSQEDSKRERRPNWLKEGIRLENLSDDFQKLDRWVDRAKVDEERADAPAIVEALLYAFDATWAAIFHVGQLQRLYDGEDLLI